MSGLGERGGGLEQPLTRKEQETREQLSGSAPQVHSDDRLYGDVGTSYPAPNDLSGASQT